MAGKIMVQSSVKGRALSFNGQRGIWSAGCIAPAGSRLLFSGGFTSRDREGNVVAPNDAIGQTRQILENMKVYCEEQGATLADVLTLQVFITDMDDWAGIHAVRQEYFPVDPPSSCLVQVSRMVDPLHKIEMVPVILLPGE